MESYRKSIRKEIYKLIDFNKYVNFLNRLENKILEKEFEKNLLEVQKIDLKHYSKKVNISDLKEDILKYKVLKTEVSKYKNLQILLPGNPDIVFKLCLESIRYDLNMKICIEDFCLAQNTFIIETINQLINDCKLKNKIEIKNLQSDNSIIENSKNVDMTICIGNSNIYNRLENKIENLKLNSYGIFEIYADSEEFDELEKMIFEYLTLNQFESEMYDDLDFEDAVRLINKNGYNFCSVLISNDEEKIKQFKNNINSKYVVINENPFSKIKFNLDLN